MLKTPLLLPLTLISALLTYLAQENLGLSLTWAFAFKPLTTVLIIAYAWQRGLGTPLVRRWVLAGLVFSLVGDIALLWPQGFIIGLLAFLAAHLAYLWAFTRVQRLAARPAFFIAYAAMAASVLSQLWQGIPDALKFPVSAYVVCLSAMAAQAAVVGAQSQGTPGAQRGRVLMLGGLLFFMSDGCLAINRFAGPVPLASLLVLPTYWAAQWCIASWLAPAGEEQRA